MSINHNHNYDSNQLARKIKQLGKEMGFTQVGITDTQLAQEVNNLKTWVASNYHGGMKYFVKHLDLYAHPEKLFPQTQRVICCRISYPRPHPRSNSIAAFAKSQDYSLYISQLLKEYAGKISTILKIAHQSKVFSGNAPVLEKALAVKAGLGWYGKNSILLSQNAGSYFFLGEIFTDLASLPIDQPVINRCGGCFQCG